MMTLTLNFCAYIKATTDHESGQGNPQELDSVPLGRIQDQSLRLPFVLGKIRLGPASIGDERRDVFIGLVSGILRVREETHGPCLSPVWSALFQRCLKWKQQLSRFGGGVELPNLSDNKNSLVSVVNPHDFGRVVTLAARCGSGLRNGRACGQKRQSKSSQALLTRSQDFHPDGLLGSARPLH